MESLGLTETDLETVDLLVLRGEAPDRTKMLRALVRRALDAEGLPTGGAAPICADRGEEPQTIRC